MCPNVSKSIEMYPKVSKCINKCLKLSAGFQNNKIYPKALKCIQNYPNVFINVQSYQPVFKIIQDMLVYGNLEKRWKNASEK